MKTIRPLKRSDFKALLALSIELFGQYNETDFPFNECHLYGLLNSFISNRKCYFKGMFEDGELVGWMVATPGHGHPHSPISGMSQLYYHSRLHGIAAARALVDFHEDFFAFAERHRYQAAVTSSSLPNCDVFVRLLQRAGWRPFGQCHLVRVTKFHPRRSELERGADPRVRVSGDDGVAPAFALNGRSV